MHKTAEIIALVVITVLALAAAGALLAYFGCYPAFSSQGLLFICSN